LFGKCQHNTLTDKWTNIEKGYTMIQNKQKWLFGVTFCILLIISVIVIMNVSSKKKRDLPPNPEQRLPAKMESSPATEIETVNSNNQAEQNAVGGSTAQKAGETEDKHFNKLVESDVSTSAFNMNLNLESQKNLDRLKTTDKELLTKWDLPDDVLGKTPTDKLLLHFIQSPMKVMITLYTGENEKIGVQRLLNSSSTVHEFYMRPDLAEGALKMYREYDFSPQSISDESVIEQVKGLSFYDDQSKRELLEPNHIMGLKIANIGTCIIHADKILMSPQFFPKIKGFEREFLQVLVSRYEIVSKMEQTYTKPGGTDYGMARTSVPILCLKLAENLDKELYNKLKEIEHPNGSGNKQFIDEIKNYLNK
jgi:hypothetical protein